MGTYVYTVRRKCIIAELPSGESVKLFLLKYLYKPYISWGSEYLNRPYEANIERQYKIWEKVKKNLNILLGVKILKMVFKLGRGLNTIFLLVMLVIFQVKCWVNL